MKLSKPAGMGKKTIIVWLVGLTLVLARFAEAQQSDIVASGGTRLLSLQETTIRLYF